MIITQTTYEIEECIDEVVRQIRATSLFKEYRQAKHLLEKSSEVEVLKNDFVKAREAFEAMERFINHSKDARNLQKELFLKKRKLDLHPEVARFRKKEMAIQELLDEICAKIGRSISEDILVDAGSPFFEGKKKHHCKRV